MIYKILFILQFKNLLICLFLHDLKYTDNV